MGVSSPAPGGYILSFDGFLRYYKGVSQAMQCDQEFEEILISHWGFSDTNEAFWCIIRHFAMVGLGHAFPNHSGKGSLSQHELADGFQRVGLRLGSSNVQQIAGSLGQGPEGSIQELQQKIRDLCAAGSSSPTVHTDHPDVDNASLQQMNEAGSASNYNCDVHSACSELCTEPD